MQNGMSALPLIATAKADMDRAKLARPSLPHYNSHLLQRTRKFLFRWYAPLWRQFVDHLRQHLAKTGY